MNVGYNHKLVQWAESVPVVENGIILLKYTPRKELSTYNVIDSNQLATDWL